MNHRSISIVSDFDERDFIAIKVLTFEQVVPAIHFVKKKKQK